MATPRKNYHWHLLNFFLLFLPSSQPHIFGVQENIAFEPSTMVTSMEGSTTPGPVRNPIRMVFCDKKKVDLPDSLYGQFDLPSTIATPGGTRVLSPCPHGETKVGAVRIFEIVQDSTTEKQESLVKQSQPGLTSICYLDKNSATGYNWTHVEDDGNLRKCREQAWATLGHELSTLTQDSQTITPYNMRQAVPKLTRLLRYAVKDYESARILIDSVSRLLEADEIFSDPSMATEQTRKTLFDLIDSYAKNAILQPGERISISSTAISVETVIFPPEDNLEYTYDFQSMHLPNEALTMSRRTSDKPRLQLVAYSNQLFFHWGQGQDKASSSENITDETTVMPDQEEFTGEWRVISVTFEGTKIENLTEPIVYTLPVNHTANNSQWVCVFWDTDESKWSSRGMRNVRLPNGTLQCESSHLTAFSVLLDPFPTHKENPIESDRDEADGKTKASINALLPDDIHAHILSLLSSVGSALSITGLAITVLTFGLFRCLRKERSNRILLNLSISLFFLHLMSLISDVNLWHHYCLVPSALLHYLLLSSISWMLVEAHHMHNLVISVFVQPQPKFLTKRSLFAWGIPLVIVTICTCLDPQVYQSGRDGWCIIAGHLNLPMYYAGYLGPAAVMLLINCYVFVRILQVLNQQGANVRKQSKMAPPEIKLDSSGSKPLDWKSIKSTSSFFMVSPTQVKGAITVMVLLGVGWILGFFAIGPFKLVFSYLFCLCNAGQGVLIFLFRVLLHPQASRTWRKAFTKGFAFDSDLTSFSSSSRKSHSGQSCSSTPSTISASTSVTNTLTRSDPSSTKLAATLASFLQAPP
ncbi:unnamed protein product [Allacma fusca]|uniref:Uncharacterized protein n=1 Tax=Allacma fusca TaxID=39272 RepID=A0A8J2LDA8_9HEXA|nr:unnamed protein product [Allacma fusca]